MKKLILAVAVLAFLVLSPTAIADDMSAYDAPTIDDMLSAYESRLDTLEEAMFKAGLIDAKPAYGCTCPFMENCNGTQEWVWWCFDPECCFCIRQSC